MFNNSYPCSRQHFPTLEQLEDRSVPSTTAATFSDGVWRWDSSAGWGHISNLQATRLTVTDAGDVYGQFSNGIWRWSAATASWQKLSDLTASSFKTTADGVLYGDFSAGGVWRWSFAGWQKLSAADVTEMAISNTDTFFGSFANGTWRWTPTAGWSLLSGMIPHEIQADGLGNLVGRYAPDELWRWSAETGWADLAQLDSTGWGRLLDVSSNGQIFRSSFFMGQGTQAFPRLFVHRYDPSAPNLGWQNAGTLLPPFPLEFSLQSVAGSDGGVFFLTTAPLTSGTNIPTTYEAAYSPRNASNIIDVFDTQNPVSTVVAGKDGDFFLNFNTQALYQWSPTLGLVKLSNLVSTVVASQR